MFCELCTMNVVRGVIYSASRPGGGSQITVCSGCRDLIMRAKKEEINEPMCACGKLEEWVCRVAITAPCKPQTCAEYYGVDRPDLTVAKP